MAAVEEVKNIELKPGEEARLGLGESFTIEVDGRMLTYTTGRSESPSNPEGTPCLWLSTNGSRFPQFFPIETYNLPRSISFIVIPKVGNPVSFGIGEVTYDPSDSTYSISINNPITSENLPES